MPEIPSIDLDNIANRNESKTYNSDWYSKSRKSVKNAESQDPDTYDEDIFDKKFDEAYNTPAIEPKPIKNSVKNIWFKTPPIVKSIWFKVPKIWEK